MSGHALQPDFVEVCTLNSGKNLIVNGRRVCGPDYGGGGVGNVWRVKKSELLAALGQANSQVILDNSPHPGTTAGTTARGFRVAPVGFTRKE